VESSLFSTFFLKGFFVETGSPSNFIQTGSGRTWKTRGRSPFTQAVDLYPTIVALVGLPSPLSQGEELNGTNLEPVFDAPEDTAVASGLKTAAFSQLAKSNLQNLFQIGGPPAPGGPAHNTTNIMGYSIRTDGWRYTCWFKFNNATIVPITTADAILGRELYDHRADDALMVPGTGETVNVVGDSAHARVVEELHTAVLGYIRLYPVPPGSPQ
jgi:iduronate 2-sulfatase